MPDVREFNRFSHWDDVALSDGRHEPVFYEGMICISKRAIGCFYPEYENQSSVPLVHVSLISGGPGYTIAADYNDLLDWVNGKEPGCLIRWALKM